ncbi:hypothetical protein RFI_36018 [Reticulomyxa filosa]|uniref:Uncharacterized protein n=1 Tax=Reticulomyxa filosa TaxID=46433 RepID=X6LJB0_RETFI|nr:hypothetical protein RFI_36018 [Reticulomyxa filosa]|eukprot:ETO01426.1 hypothetical protein RFI_36018 [Reticulomyxa filosa]
MVTDDGSAMNQQEMSVERKLQLAERANEIYREQVRDPQNRKRGRKEKKRRHTSINVYALQRSIFFFFNFFSFTANYWGGRGNKKKKKESVEISGFLNQQRIRTLLFFFFVNGMV